jgi:hypothetical protein
MHIFIWAHQDLLILRRPRPVLVLCPIDTGLVAAVLGFRRQLGGRRWLAVRDGFLVPVGARTRGAICSTGGAGPWWDRAWWLE